MIQVKQGYSFHVLSKEVRKGTNQLIHKKIIGRDKCYDENKIG